MLKSWTGPADVTLCFHFLESVFPPRLPIGMAAFQNMVPIFMKYFALGAHTLNRVRPVYMFAGREKTINQLDEMRAMFDAFSQDRSMRFPIDTVHDSWSPSISILDRFP